MILPVITKNMSDDELDELANKATNASAFLKAISHEGRLMILCHLVSGEKSVTELEDLISAAAEGNPKISKYECSVFNGEYVTGDVDEVYLKRLANIRNDAAKIGKKKNNQTRKQNLVADLNTDA